MTVDEFSGMSMLVRDIHVQTSGDHLGTQEDPEGWSYFYKIDDFYVEVRIVHDEIDAVAVEAFTGGERYQRMLRTLSV